MRVDFDSAQPAQLLTLKIQFTDDAHHTYFDSTEYTAGVPDVQVSTYSSQSEYLNLNTTGLVDNLRIEVVGDDVSYPIALVGVEINARHPFDFNMVRFFAVAGMLALVYAFRPRSAIYRIGIVQDPQEVQGRDRGCRRHRGMPGGLVFVHGIEPGGRGHPKLQLRVVGRAQPGEHVRGGRRQRPAVCGIWRAPWRRASCTSTKSRRSGCRTWTTPTTRGHATRRRRRRGSPTCSTWPTMTGTTTCTSAWCRCCCSICRSMLLTGANFPTAIGVLIAAVAFVLGCSALLDRFARYHFKRVSLGLYLLLQIPLVACCGVLYLLKFPTFYSLPIMCGLAFSVWGLYFWMRGRVSKRPEKWYLAGSLCMALVAGCRPQLLALSLLAFPLFWRLVHHGAPAVHAAGRARVRLPGGPLRGGGGRASVDTTTRGSGRLFDFGANYNLTVNDMTKRGMNVGRLAPALFAYFLQPPCATGRVPLHPGGAVRHHLYGADHQGGHVRRHPGVPAACCGSCRSRAASCALRMQGALDAHHHGRHRGAAGRRAWRSRCSTRRWRASCSATTPTSASCSWRRRCCSRSS